MNVFIFERILHIKLVSKTSILLFYLNLGSFQHLAKKKTKHIGKMPLFSESCLLILTWFVTQSHSHFLSITIIYKYSCSRIFLLFKMEFITISAQMPFNAWTLVILQITTSGFACHFSPGHSSFWAFALSWWWVCMSLSQWISLLLTSLTSQAFSSVPVAFLLLLFIMCSFLRCPGIFNVSLIVQRNNHFSTYTLNFFYFPTTLGL